MPQRMIIADDHPMLIDGLTKVLGEMPDLVLLEPVNNGIQLIDRLREAPADLVLLDLQMPLMDGIATLKVLRREFPAVRIIVFTNYNQPKLIREIKAEGAHGFLPKNSTSLTLKEAVAHVASGGTWFRDEVPSPPPSKHFMDDFIKKYQLTKREVEVIRRISKGLTSKEIAEDLFVSEFTVNTHRRNICRKLNIYTPVGLLNFAKEHGLV
jgi:DNA-binding NarL/FixJ family response regulator